MTTTSTGSRWFMPQAQRLLDGDRAPDPADVVHDMIEADGPAELRWCDSAPNVSQPPPEGDRHSANDPGISPGSSARMPRASPR
jgi:hypothetical protein